MRLLEQILERTAWWMRLVVSFLPITGVLTGCGSASVTPPATHADETTLSVSPGGKYEAFSVTGSGRWH